MENKEYGDELFIYAMALLEEEEKKERNQQKNGEPDND